MRELYGSANRKWTNELECHDLIKKTVVGYPKRIGVDGDGAEKNPTAPKKHRGVLFVYSKRPKKKI
jgi:hypothetical protein